METQNYDENQSVSIRTEFFKLMNLFALASACGCLWLCQYLLMSFFSHDRNCFLLSTEIVVSLRHRFRQARLIKAKSVWKKKEVEGTRKKVREKKEKKGEEEEKKMLCQAKHVVSCKLSCLFDKEKSLLFVCVFGMRCVAV